MPGMYWSYLQLMTKIKNGGTGVARALGSSLSPVAKPLRWRSASHATAMLRGAETQSKSEDGGALIAKAKKHDAQQHQALLAVRVLIVFLALVCLPAMCSAAGQPDNRGVDFYFTFLPNYHSNDNSNIRDSLYLVIAAEEAATGVITLRDINGTETTINFSIPDPATVYRTGLPWRPYELRGCNRNGTLNFGGADNQNGKVAPQSVHITSDKEVAVYALSQAAKTSDAMMVLPTDVLDSLYYVMSYYSDARVETDIFGTKRLTAQSTPSQCAITAVEDNTVVTITPSVRVRNGITTPFSITLQRGDSYLLQADMYTNIPNADLTGTAIESTKPVAVFGGHQRSLLPVSSTTLVSRDFLAEQMLPVSSWGKRYLLTPFPSPPNLAAGSMDVYRILAAHDNTEIRIGEAVVATLRAGQYYQAQLKEPALVEASQDVLVAQYKGSSQESDTDRLSDPFFILVPPLKQFLKSYTFAATQVTATPAVYREQYITIFCPSAACSTIALDGIQVDQSLFKPVPLSCYSYAWIRVGDGAHRIEAEKNFGLYVYGYGFADSYGYVGGMAFTAEKEPAIVALGDTTLCRGDTARLSASGGVLYAWTGDHLSCTDCPNPTAVPEVSTLYTVAITDENGCAYERKISVRVNQPPIAVCSSDTAICTGSQVTISASGGSGVQWSPPEGLSCVDCPAPIASPRQPTMYVATVVNTFGCTAVDSVFVDVSPFPIAAIANDTTVCTDTPVLLQASGGTRYVWFPSNGLSCTNCSSPTAITSQTRMYYVQVFNDAGCSVLDSVLVTIKPCQSISSINSAVVFGEFSLCDSVEQLCSVSNVGNAPLDVFSWALRGNNATAFSAFPVLPNGSDFPVTLAPGDSLHFRIVFHPEYTGSLTAQLAVQTSGAPSEAVCVLQGGGVKGTVAFSLVPRIAATEAGAVAGFDIRADNGDWNNAALNQLVLEVNYQTEWLAYAGTIIPGAAVDNTWQFTAEEQLEGNGTYTTVITAVGATPLAASGTIATVQMDVFLDTDRLLTPTLRVVPIGRERCVEVQTTAEPLDVSTCARQLRPIRYTGQPLFVEMPGGTVETDGMIELRYGVPFASDVHIEVYTAMGQILYKYSTSYSGATQDQYVVDLRHCAQQMLIVRCWIAGRWMTKQVLLVR